MKQGKLIISLDFELIWGVFDHFNLSDNSTYFNNTLNNIPDVLDLFESLNIHATWATVGMLFNKNKEEWLSNIPDLTPSYIRTELSAYDYGQENINKNNQKYFFAPKLIKSIIDSDGQDMGTHTYSHYYCLEEGQTSAEFEADLLLSKEVANKFNNKPSSLVFPRNQFNPEYLGICQQQNIDTVRTNPDYWFWDTLTGESIQKKVLRSADAYLPIGKMMYSDEDINKVSGIYKQPASRFLRPLSKYNFVNTLRNQRIKREIIQAAKSGSIYHLWWHPHNFGMQPEESLAALKDILLTFDYARKEFGMKSQNMKDVAMEKY